MFKTAPLKRLVRFLKDQTGYDVSTTRPIGSTKSSAGILIQRVGTWDIGESSLAEIDRPVFDIWCYAKDIGTAYDMADVVSRAMEFFKYEPYISSCMQYSAYDDSDPSNGPAFKLSYRITYIE